ncbi:arrestin domain-containing protein 3-like isoform X2 [Perca fluviatilis]|uniref:arrestin domain-containing protein 3-like isoform X2 n=1 Tax=Perca fluviatilis TaxID=8168 RepID=UPI0019632DED|nr:arrestin domain-containing protein 3-like isoform X2 [Perca fluviatilis]
MPAIQSLTMTYDALNEYGTFSEGDTLTGKVTLALSKDTTVESLFVKAKGDADVRWTKKVGDRNHTYSAHKRYFKLKQFLIPENSNETLVPQGTHVYKFSFTIPPGSSPSSFKGSHGKIVYKLEAKLSRSWRLNRTVETDIHFVSKAFPNLHSLVSRQVGSTKKDMGLFSKGHAHMDVIVDRKAYAQGETMVIVAKIDNSSSSEMIPKFSLIKDVVYRANGHTKHESSVIQKLVDNCIKSRTQRDVRCAIKIPRDQTPTIQNCDIISVEYHLKAYLDISFAFDPEVIFPVVIIPQDLSPGPRPGVPMGPYPAGAIGGPSVSDFPPPAVSMGPYPAGAIGGPSVSHFPPPAVSMGPYPVSLHSGSYGYPGAQMSSAPPRVHPDNPPAYPGTPGVYPAQPAHINGGYNNPVPPLAALYGSPFSSSSSSSVLHPPPTAPTFQPPPPAPELHPSRPPPQPFNTSPTAPTYTLLPSAPMMNTDFLSQSDEAPPAYSLLFPSSATDKSVAK